MSFKIDEFISHIGKQGIAPVSNFKVIITPPSAGSTSDYSGITMRCEQVDFPGRNINIYESNYTGMPYKIAMGATQPEISISIILSSDLREKILLQEWQDKIVGSYRTGSSGSMFNIKYYKDYIGNVEIMQYDETDKLVYSCKLIDAFPSVIGNITGNWQTGNEIHRLPVTFVYRYFEDKKESK